MDGGASASATQDMQLTRALLSANGGISVRKQGRLSLAHGRRQLSAGFSIFKLSQEQNVGGQRKNFGSANFSQVGTAFLLYIPSLNKKCTWA
jgi:hypothetical protein